MLLPEPAPLRNTLELVTLTWVFGSVWATAVTGVPLTRFATELNASPWQFGLLTAMPFLASLLSLPASMLIEHTGARKAFFLGGVYVNRLLWFAIALVPVWIVSRYGMAQAPRAVFWFLLLTFLMHAGQAVGGPAWVSWMADVVPGRVRGKFFSRRRQWGILPALPVALFCGWLLDHDANAGAMRALHWCALIFMCAAVFGVADVHLFHYVPDVKRPAPRRGPGLLRAMARPLRDRQFLVFGSFTGMMTFSLCFMTQFVSLYLIKHLHVSSTQSQLMLVVGPMLAQLLVLGAWGTAADRMGKKPVLIIAGLGLVPVGLGWVLVGPERLWLAYVLLAAGAALWTGVEVANLNLVMEMGGKARRDANANSATAGGTAYVATNTVIINIAGCVGGLAAGLIAQGLKDWSWHPFASAKIFTSFDVLFVVSGVLRLVSVAAFLPFLSEAGAKSTWQTLCFLAGSLHGTVSDAAAALARLLLPPDDRTVAGLDAFADAFRLVPPASPANVRPADA